MPGDIKIYCIVCDKAYSQHGLDKLKFCLKWIDTVVDQLNDQYESIKKLS